MDEFLAALLSREGMPEGADKCQHCDKAAFAAWRCKDCTFSSPMCRACMRRSHRDNPFHRIEHWNGGYFQSAELWEVGTYLFVRHYVGEGICDNLRIWCDFLERAEEIKDNAEQRRLQESPMSAPVSKPVPEYDENEVYIDPGMEDEDDDDDYRDDEETEKVDILNPYLAANAEVGAETPYGVYAEPTTANFNPTANAESTINADHSASAESNARLGTGPQTGNYLRVVHSNGLHNIAMVSCLCRGDDALPLDLFASQLIPASLKRIRTLFTAQVLDMFRLSNLELKASAYQFYQMLCRLTRPMAPADVTNLYREFRRMSRLWRWMKKLKWAGYSSNKTVNDVGPGDLAIYCPACPQPGINIPDDWKDDPLRHVKYFSLSSL